MTLYQIDRSRGGRGPVRRLIGAAIVSVMTSDRFLTDKVVPGRQVHRAQPRRDFLAMIDRTGGQGVVADTGRAWSSGGGIGWV